MIEEKMQEMLDSVRHYILSDPPNFLVAYQMLNRLYSYDEVGAFSHILLKAEINPLEYDISTVPDNFCTHKGILKHINLPSSLKVISEEAFKHCVLEAIFLPKSISKLGRYCFSGCMEDGIYFEGTKEEFRKIHNSSPEWEYGTLAKKFTVMTEHGIYWRKYDENRCA